MHEAEKEPLAGPQPSHGREDPARGAIETVGYEEFAGKQRDPGVAIVDVLPPASFENAHIPGAVNLPLAELGERATRLLPDRSQEILTYCASFT